MQRKFQKHRNKDGIAVLGAVDKESDADELANEHAKISSCVKPAPDASVIMISNCF